MPAMNTVIFVIRSVRDQFKRELLSLLGDLDKWMFEQAEKRQPNEKPVTAKDWYFNDRVIELENKVQMLEAVIRDLEGSKPDISEADYWNNKMRRNPSMK